MTQPKVIVNGKETTKVVINGVATFELPKVLEETTITPTTSVQEVLPGEGVDGFSKIDVEAVTSSIDSNIIPGNIKKDTTILGVTGTLESGITPTGTIDITENGTHDVTNYASAIVNVSISENPLTASTDAEMTALDIEDNVGKIVKFTGTSITYVTNAYYLIEESSTQKEWLWVANDSLTNFPPQSTNINFYVNLPTTQGAQKEYFTSIGFKGTSVAMRKLCYDDTEVYDFDFDSVSSEKWLLGNEYQLVYFTEEPTGDLLTWLQANGEIEVIDNSNEQ